MKSKLRIKVSRSIPRLDLNLLFLIFFFFGIGTSSIDPLIPIISIELGRGYSLIGIILFVGLFFLLVSNIIVGRLCDKYDIKKILVISFILIIVSSSVFGTYINLIIFILFIIIIRLGYGGLDTSVYAYVCKFFYKERSQIFVKLNLLWYLGCVVGPLLISGELLLKINPRYSFLLLAVSFAVLTILFVRIGVRKVQKQGNFTGSPEKNTARIFDLLKNPVILVTCLLQFFYSASIYGLTSWLTTYFAALNINVLIGSSILSIYWLSSIAGLLIISHLLKKISEIKVVFFSYLLGLFCMVAVTFLQPVYLKIIFLGLQGVLLSGIFPLLKSIPVEEKPELFGTILGLVLTSGGMGIMVFQPILGYIAEHKGGGSIIYALLASLSIGFLFASILYILKSKRKHLSTNS